jgi:hypothetical protein
MGHCHKRLFFPNLYGIKDPPTKLLLHQRIQLVKKYILDPENFKRFLSNISKED